MARNGGFRVGVLEPRLIVTLTVVARALGPLLTGLERIAPTRFERAGVPAPTRRARRPGRVPPIADNARGSVELDAAMRTAADADVSPTRQAVASGPREPRPQHCNQNEPRRAVAEAPDREQFRIRVSWRADRPGTGDPEGGRRARAQRVRGVSRRRPWSMAARSGWISAARLRRRRGVLEEEAREGPSEAALRPRFSRLARRDRAVSWQAAPTSPQMSKTPHACRLRVAAPLAAAFLSWPARPFGRDGLGGGLFPMGLRVGAEIAPRRLGKVDVVVFRRLFDIGEGQGPVGVGDAGDLIEPRHRVANVLGVGQRLLALLRKGVDGIRQVALRGELAMFLVRRSRSIASGTPVSRGGAAWSPPSTETPEAPALFRPSGR